VHSRLGFVLFSSVCLSIAASAQVPSMTNVSGSEFIAPAATISKTVNEVDLAFTVTDKRGHFISNLHPSDFQLRDNHQQPDRLTYFQQRSDLPLHLAVLIDASASIEYRFRFEQNAAIAFLKKVLRPGIDKAFVIAFNDRVRVVQDLTDKTEKLSSALKKVKPEGNTSLYDAVVDASSKLSGIRENQTTRRAVVLISDGVDTVNRSTVEQAEQAAVHGEVMIFPLSTNYSEQDPNGGGDAILKELAEVTGGILLPAHDENALSSAFRNVEKALRNQYVLAYNPVAFNADGSYRTVEVVPLKHGLRTNCRKGYYARVRTEQ
jgi:Ca-activated chloride channel family protein